MTQASGAAASRPPSRVVVVGGSLAGSRTVLALRRAGHDGPITLVSAEPHLPYDRPPLSKELLAGETTAAEIALDPKGAQTYRDLDVEVLLGSPATALDVERKVVAVGAADRPADRTAGRAAGTELPYDVLVIATGATARPLPGTERFARRGSRVHTLRTVDDALAIRAELSPGAAVVVVGAGFIGSEVAASAVARGCDVTVVEAAPAPLTRGLGSRLGAAVGALHERNGARLLLGAGVAEILGGRAGSAAGTADGAGDTATAVRLTDGTVLPADVVVVGIGVVPATGWLAGSGLALDDGVLCDGCGRAGAPGVYAVGDVARLPNAWLGPEPVRTEHWTAAVEHASLVAANIVGPDEAAVYDSVPFVWSDQYDARIQIAGHTSESLTMAPLLGDVDGDAFVAGFHDGDRLRGVVALNSMRAFVRFRRLLTEHPTSAQAADLAQSLAAGPP